MHQRVLARLGRIHPTGAFLGVTVLVLVAMVLPGPVGGLLLLALAAGLAWLMRHTWALHSPPARGFRLLILALLVVVGVSRLI